jgi:thioredoxin reductase (NADPH)
MESKEKVENVIIIGSGPAAHTCAIYLGRELLSPLLLEGDNINGIPPGGLLMTTTVVENYPGFIEIQGPELMAKMREQSLANGTKIQTETVTKIDVSAYPYCVYTEETKYLTKSIVIATGSSAKRLHVENEDKFFNYGISTCAVCDGALPCFRNQPLAVVGGGDSAIEEATFLTKFSSCVFLLVRSDKLRASQSMQERLSKNTKIIVMYNTQVLSVAGIDTDTQKKLEKVAIMNNVTKKIGDLQVSGLFYAIGHTPNTKFLMSNETKSVVALNENDQIKTFGMGSQSSVPGIFSAGDVQDKAGKYRQAITAAGSGYVAAFDVRHFLESGHAAGPAAGAAGPVGLSGHPH